MVRALTKQVMLFFYNFKHHLIVLMKVYQAENQLRDVDIGKLMVVFVSKDAKLI